MRSNQEIMFTRTERFSPTLITVSLLVKARSTCPTFLDCGFQQPNSGVVLSYLDCFFRNGSLYCFEYGVAPSIFLAKVRGGTCNTTASDPPETVIHQAMYLLQNGFGNYDIFQNNCEDFALYCKTGLLVMDKQGFGRNGQASSAIGAPLAALLSSPLKLLVSSPVGVATVTAGMYCMSRYATDIGVRSDVIKMAVEDLAVNLGWATDHDQAAEENEASGQFKIARDETEEVSQAKVDLRLRLGVENEDPPCVFSHEAVEDHVKAGHVKGE